MQFETIITLILISNKQAFALQRKNPVTKVWRGFVLKLSRVLFDSYQRLIYMGLRPILFQISAAPYC